jgi:prepilin peptidase CpaA
MLSTILVFVLSGVAAFTDLVYHKLYNWMTYPGIVAALIVAYCEGGLADRGGLEESIMGLAWCGSIMLVCFVLFNVGGGDVKLIAMLGAFLGPAQGIETMLWTFVLGAIFALGVLVWRVGAWRLFASVSRQLLWSLRVGNWLPLSDEERKNLQSPLYLAPAAVLALTIVKFDLARIVYP